jgi:hypothetical protein
MPAPAAGPQAVAFLSTGNAFEYYPDVPVEPPSEPPVVNNNGPCNAGDTCGFATYQFGREFCGEGADLAPVPAVIRLTWGLSGEGAGSFQPLGWPSFRKHGHWIKGVDAGATFVIDAQEQQTSYPQQQSVNSPDYSHVDVWSHTFKISNYTYTGDGSVLRATLIGALGEQYLLAGYWERFSYPSEQEEVPPVDAWGFFVYGTTTSADDLQSLQAGNVVANYCGVTGFGNHLQMSADFGNGTWSGVWGDDGHDGFNVRQYSDGAGSHYLKGAVGFTASGTINGVNISSDTVGTNDSGSSVSGSVSGAFFGPSAAAVGGISDITKSKNGEGGYAASRNVDVFVATQSGSSPP